MPIHDWSLVSAGTFHDFHGAWMVELRNVLNSGLLPPDYYAQTDQVAGQIGPDVLTMKADSTNGHPVASGGDGIVAVAESPPRVRYTARAEIDEYIRKQRKLIIRHSSEHRIVAIIEIVSAGNKASQHAIFTFVQKAKAILDRGNHLLLIDLQPTTPRDPQGIHGALWSEIESDDYRIPADKPLTLAAYSAGEIISAFVEPVAVGDVLPHMPLFLEIEGYINIPLEATYRAAWQGMPRYWQSVLEKS